MLRRVLVPITATIGIGLLVLSAARFLIVLDVTIGSDRGYLLVGRLLASFVPHYLSFMLPLAVYWGCYSAVRGLATNSELAILQATGTSLQRIFMPLIILGLGVTCINLAVVGWLQPLGRYSYRAIVFKLENENFYLKARDSTFMKVGNQTVLIDKIRSDRRSFDHIFIFEPLEQGGTSTITAESGRLISTAMRPVLRLFDGEQIKVMDREDPNAVQHLDFATLDLPLDAVISSFRPRGDDENELLLPEFFAQEGSLPNATEGEISGELNRKLVIALSSLFMPMLAASLAVLNPRKKNIYQSILVLLIVIVYHQIVEFGAGLIEKNGVNPAIALWPVFFLFAGISLALFRAVSHRPGTVEDHVSALVGWFTAIPARFLGPKATHRA